MYVHSCPRYAEVCVYLQWTQSRCISPLPQLTPYSSWQGIEKSSQTHSTAFNGPSAIAVQCRDDGAILFHATQCSILVYLRSSDAAASVLVSLMAFCFRPRRYVRLPGMFYRRRRRRQQPHSPVAGSSQQSLIVCSTWEAQAKLYVNFDLHGTGYLGGNNRIL